MNLEISGVILGATHDLCPQTERLRSRAGGSVRIENVGNGWVAIAMGGVLVLAAAPNANAYDHDPRPMPTGTLMTRIVITIVTKFAKSNSAWYEGRQTALGTFHRIYESGLPT